MYQYRKTGVILSVVLAVGISAAWTGGDLRPDCASMARAVASRNHSMLDGVGFRATARQAESVCLADPVAFRRITRID